MPNLLFWLETFDRVMCDDLALLRRGLELQGWVSVGHKLRCDTVDVMAAVERYNPRLVLFWTGHEMGLVGRGPMAPLAGFEHTLQGWKRLRRERPDIQRATMLNDACSYCQMNRLWHERFAPHWYVTPYHADAVRAADCAPWVPADRIVRYYHPIESDRLPAMGEHHLGAVVSGALVEWHDGPVYPLRKRLVNAAYAGELGGTAVIEHPGYTQPPGSLSYAEKLSQYRVSIVTVSKFNFALRKLMEATAMGCKVVTNLPHWDVLPEIDDNLVRIPSDVAMGDLKRVLDYQAGIWDRPTQVLRAERARAWYDYRAVTARLHAALEERVNR